MQPTPIDITKDLTALFGDAKADKAIPELLKRARFYKRSDEPDSGRLRRTINISAINWLFDNAELNQALTRIRADDDRGNLAVSLPLADAMCIKNLLEKNTLAFDESILNFMIRALIKGDYKILLPVANTPEMADSVYRLNQQFRFDPALEIRGTQRGGELLMDRAQYETMINEWQKTMDVDARAHAREFFKTGPGSEIAKKFGFTEDETERMIGGIVETMEQPKQDTPTPAPEKTMRALLDFADGPKPGNTVTATPPSTATIVSLDAFRKARDKGKTN